MGLQPLTASCCCIWKRSYSCLRDANLASSGSPRSPRILTLHRARGQGCAVPLPRGDGLSDKQHTVGLRICWESNSMWKRYQWREAEALRLCLCQLWLGWTRGAASCCSARERTLLPLQMFLLTGTDKPSPLPSKRINIPRLQHSVPSAPLPGWQLGN